MKKLFFILFVLCISGCYNNTAPPGFESVVVENPFIFGHGGVQDETQKPGLSWYFLSTKTVDVPITPTKYDENLEHLATNDNNFINYNSYIVLQWKDPAYLVKKFGYEKWYENNLKEQYRTIVRDVTKEYSMTKIMTDQQTLLDIENKVAERFRKHIESTGLHVDLININMGKVLPNANVIDEMDNTAVQQQRIKTESQRKLAEDSRMAAEQSRAKADNAYRESMQLNASQFVQLESIKKYSEACATSKSCVIVQGNTPVMIGQ